MFDLYLNDRIIDIDVDKTLLFKKVIMNILLDITM